MCWRQCFWFPSLWEKQMPSWISGVWFLYAIHSAYKFFCWCNGIISEASNSQITQETMAFFKKFPCWVFFPMFTRKDMVSQPVKAWNANKLPAAPLGKLLKVSLIGIYLRWFAVPLLIQRCSHCIFGKCASNMTRTSVSFDATTTSSNGQFKAWRTNLVSASSCVALNWAISVDVFDDRTSCSSLNPPPTTISCSLVAWEQSSSDINVQDHLCF